MSIRPVHPGPCPPLLRHDPSRPSSVTTRSGEARP